MTEDLEVIEAEVCESDDNPIINDRKLKLAEMVSVGYKVIDIAATLRVSEAWVRKHRNDKEVVDVVKSLHRETIEMTKSSLINSTTRAVNTLNRLMDAGPPVVALAAANTALDRVGIGVQQKNDNPGGPIINLNFNNMPKEELRKNIQDRMKVLELEE